jgi:hypothetical protein
VWKLKRLVKDVGLSIRLTPKRELSLSAQRRLWQKLLDQDFRSSIGKPEIDHIVSSGPNESHVHYRIAGIDFVIYDRGRADMNVEKFVAGRTRQIEKILAAILRAIGQATPKPWNLEVSALLHVILPNPAMRRFLRENMRVRPTPKFREAFGKYVGFRSFVLMISNTLSISFVSPSHIDFLYHDTISTAPSQKPFVDDFAIKSMQYIESVGRCA